jgi:hypothetical protein
MRARTILLLTLALCFVGVGVCFASDLNIGTWKLNEAKSKIPPGMLKNVTVVYEAAGDEIKVTTDGTDQEGKPMHTEWTGKFDGKDYPLTGDPTADSRSYVKVDDHKLMLANKMNGKVVNSGHIVIAADGKSRTLFVNGTNSAGKKIRSTAVYDKQ